jgi:hypothetical protein
MISPILVCQVTAETHLANQADPAPSLSKYNNRLIYHIFAMRLFTESLKQTLFHPKSSYNPIQSYRDAYCDQIL